MLRGHWTTKETCGEGMKRARPDVRAGGFYDRIVQERHGVHPRVLYVGDELSFELCNIGILHSIRVINIGGRKLSRGDDILHFKLIFSPEIPGGDAQGMGHLLRRAALRVCRKGNLQDSHLFMWLRPTRWTMTTRIMDGEDDRKFWEFPTHQLEVNAQTNGVCGMYLILENNQLSYDDIAPKIEPHVDIASYHIIPTYGTERYVALDWYPLDPLDRALEGIHVSQIQQRTPVWFNLRPGKTSGSTAGKKAAGFWVERDEEDKNNYHTMEMGKQVRQMVGKRNRMRFGRIREDDVPVIFLHNYPDFVFVEQGYIDYPWPAVPNPAAPEMKDFVKRWGASPDGSVFNPNMTWSMFPKNIREAYEHCATTTVDPRRATFEAKCSYASTKFPDYYVPQLYWEMMADNTCHSYLLRYKRRRGHDSDGTYKTLRQCNSYHVYRNPEVEMVLVRNVLYTVRMLQKHPDLDLVTLIRQDPKRRYSSCRKMCKAIAESIEPRIMEIPEDILEAGDRLRWEILREAKQGAQRMEPIKNRAMVLATKKRPRYAMQPDAYGDPARIMALMAVEERLRTIQRINDQVESDDMARSTFMQLCKDQQETYRLLVEEMVRLSNGSD